MKVALDTPQKEGQKPLRGAKKALKPTRFNEWVGHYAKMSGGNPV